MSPLGLSVKTFIGSRVEMRWLLGNGYFLGTVIYFKPSCVSGRMSAKLL